ncbi:MAG: PID-CTERM protein-sorting domain-containing protein [Janthinobacterium lividum]
MKNLFSVSFRAFTAGAVLALAAGASLQARAQGSTGPTPTDPVTPPVTPPVTLPTDVPLDGGASLLLASGVAYGVRMLRHRRK